MGFLDKGSLLKHRNLGFVVRITDVVEGRYFLGWDKPWEEDSMTRHMFMGKWTAVDIVRDFSPQVPESKWDRLLDDDYLLTEEPHPQE